MEKEISSGTMLGIVLIALAAVIGLGFGVFSIAKGVANEGVVNVQDNLGTVSEAAFTDYDQKIVTGTQVGAAYKQFEGKAVAIIINNQAMATVRAVPTHAAHVIQIGGKNYINYNAVLANTAGTVTKTGGVSANGDLLSSASPVNNAIVSVTNGTYQAQGAFLLDTSGKVVFGNNTAGFARAGNCEFISSSAKYDAAVIKDQAGTIVGVVFTQLGM